LGGLCFLQVVFIPKRQNFSGEVVLHGIDAYK
jgi:hypothetical protein